MASTDKTNKPTTRKVSPYTKPSRFTSEMQDRQARGKDPKTGLPLDLRPEGEGVSKSPPPEIHSAENSYEAKEARRRAAVILDSPELLTYFSLSRNESTAATRHYFTKVFCGFDDAPKERKEGPVAPEAQNYTPYTGSFEL